MGNNREMDTRSHKDLRYLSKRLVTAMHASFFLSLRQGTYLTSACREDKYKVRFAAYQGTLGTSETCLHASSSG